MTLHRHLILLDLDVLENNKAPESVIVRESFGANRPVRPWQAFFTLPGEPSLG